MCNKAWSGYNVALQRFPIKASMGSILMAQIVIAMVIEAPLAMMFFESPDRGAFAASTVVHLAYLGVGASALAYIGWQHAARLMGPECAGVFSNLIPLFALVFAVCLLNERLQSSELIGAVLILVSLVVVQARGRRQKSPASPATAKVLVRLR
ncbi:MAG: EamA family transporter [Shimia sp.]|uniref:EamA family transporter n=1 Tax=Shimia sp. TaxID=1954381 RepID=UPI004058CCB0